jgi:hypothetical protein
LRDEGVSEIIATPSGVVAVAGAGVAVLEVGRDGRGAARHLLRLPVLSHNHLLEPDGTLLLVTSVGVIALDPTGEASLLPCSPVP